MEDEFKLLITMCMTPTADNIDYIKKTLSSVKAAEGKNEKDSWHRQAKLKKLVKNIMPAKKYEGKDFPNLGAPPGHDINDLQAVKIPGYIDEYCEKIIIGIEHKLENRYIDRKVHDIKIFFCHDNKVNDVISMIRKLGNHHRVAEGFEFNRAVTPDKNGALYEIKLLNKLKFFGSLTLKDSN